MAGVFVLLILLSIVLLWGLISPEHLGRTMKLRKSVPRVHFGLGLSSLMLLFIILLGATSSAPKPAKTTLTSNKSNPTVTLQTKQPTVTTKTTTSTQSIAYTTKVENDSDLDKGQTKVTQTGQNGIETLAYDVTYTNGQQTSKTLVSSVVTTQPVQEITEAGTYVAPTPVSTPTSNNSSDTSATATPSACYPLSDEGTCYKPGEYCRDADAGMMGTTADGESITCEDNDGLRWEPS